MTFRTVGRRAYNNFFPLSEPDYSERVLSTAPIAYFALNEDTGATEAVNLVSGGANAPYNNLTLNSTTFLNGDGSPLWDGNTDYCNIYPAINAGFNSQTGSLSCWYKVSAAGVWTDTILRYISIIRVDGSNQILLLKNSTNNQVGGQYVAGGTTDARNFTTSSTDWIHLLLTWDKPTTNQMVLWVNGVAQAPSTVLGTWAGSLSSTECLIGNRSTNNAGQCAGYAAHWALWNRVLTDFEIQNLIYPVPN